MSRFSGVCPDGARAVGVGLTPKTYAELLEGKVMLLELAAMGVPGVRLIVVAGRNENEIAERLNHKMNEETHVVLPVTSVLRGNGK